MLCHLYSSTYCTVQLKNVIKSELYEVYYWTPSLQLTKSFPHHDSASSRSGAAASSASSQKYFIFQAVSKSTTVIIILTHIDIQKSLTAEFSTNELINGLREEAVEEPQRLFHLHRRFRLRPHRSHDESYSMHETLLQKDRQKVSIMMLSDSFEME